MADVDKIIYEAEHRYCLKEWRKASGLQLKNFGFVALMLLLGFLPLIVMTVIKAFSLLV